MSTPEDRLAELGLVLPAPLQLPPGVTLPFPWVRIVGTRAIISGHGPTNTDGSLAQPLGKVGSELSEDQAYIAARLTGMAILGSLKRQLGSLSRIAVLAPGYKAPDAAQVRNEQNKANVQTSSASTSKN